jgi:hypothetical protein
MTMTLDELRDAHAKRLGWEYCPLVFGGSWHKDGKYCKHPIPATRDAIAGLMPPDWMWAKYPDKWTADWFPKWNPESRKPPAATVTTPDTGDELTDRAQLAWLAWKAEAKGAK